MSKSRINLLWMVLFSLTLPVGVVVSTNMARRSFEKVKLRDQTIRVKGYAEQAIRSDRATWSATIVERNADRTAAYLALEKHRYVLLNFLKDFGFTVDQVRFEPVDISAVNQKNERGVKLNTIESYVVSQGFAIESDDVVLIADVSRKSSALIRDGIELKSDSPRYLYTKLNDKKLEMLAQASNNAHQRALRLVSASDNSLGPLRYASQGVFQITPAFSTEVSGSGYNDTAHIDKTIKAVVTLEYAIQ